MDAIAEGLGAISSEGSGGQMLNTRGTVVGLSHRKRRGTDRVGASRRIVSVTVSTSGFNAVPAPLPELPTSFPWVVHLEVPVVAILRDGLDTTTRGQRSGREDDGDLKLSQPALFGPLALEDPAAGGIGIWPVQSPWVALRDRAARRSGGISDSRQ